MAIRPIFVAMLLAFVLIHSSEGAFIKSKLIAAKKPFFLAKAAIVKDVGTKIKVAAHQTAGAVKAKAVAVKAVALAPFKVVAAAVGTKVAAIKSVKTAKLAKISALIKGKNAAAPQVFAAQSAVPVVPLTAFPVASVPVQVENVQSALTGLISGLKNKISQNPIVSTLRNSADTDRITNGASQRAYGSLPLYRVYHDASIPRSNVVQNIQVEVPSHASVSIQQPHQTYGVPAQ